MKIIKYSLTFINDGDAFTIPNWTVVKHKRALADLAKIAPEIPELERDDYFEYLVVYHALVEIDDSITVDDVRGIHPEDFIPLFNAIYTAGRTGILFRKGKSPKQQR